MVHLLEWCLTFFLLNERCSIDWNAIYDMHCWARSASRLNNICNEWFHFNKPLAKNFQANLLQELCSIFYFFVKSKIHKILLIRPAFYSNVNIIFFYSNPVQKLLFILNVWLIKVSKVETKQLKDHKMRNSWINL